MCGGGCGGTPLATFSNKGGREKRRTGERGPTPGRNILRRQHHDSVVRPPVAPVGVYDTSGLI